ncbi:MAG: cytochrome c [Herminiimonas sp.]|nr:cytochrome c [Herminiimonas sp.]
MNRFRKTAGWIGVAMLTLLIDHAAVAEDLSAGQKLFTQSAVPACALCHTLKHAGATGEIGPVLDELKPDAARVEQAVRNGIGQMPAYGNLTDDQIRLLAKYVSGVAGK